MSLQYTDGINLMGQSNMSALLQGLIANAIAPEVFVAGAAVGGARLANDTWLSLAEPWTRAAYYTSLIARHNGAKYQRLVSVFFQGESDTESDPLSLAHQAKVAAYHAFLAADLVATGGVLYEVILLPWNTSVGGGTGYTNVRAGLQAYVAASPSTRVAIDTASWGRSGDNVHLTPAQVATNAPTIIAAINAFLTRAAATEGGTSGGGGGGGGGATNLSCSTSTTTATIASDTGTDATIPAATGSAAGVMTAAQATKLAGIADGATANATDAQLRDRSSHTGTQAISTVTGLQTALDGKAASAHTHALSDLTVSGATSGQVPTWNGTAWAPATPSGGGGGGSGTVTTVSVVTANGVSATVANATTTPAITITLAAITPTSVNGLTITTTTGTLTLTNGKTLSVSNTLTIAGTDGSTLNIGTGGALNTAAFAAKSLGGNGAADSGKVPGFDASGRIRAAALEITNGSGNGVRLNPGPDDSLYDVFFPSSGEGFDVAYQGWVSANFAPIGGGSSDPTSLINAIWN